MAAINQSMVEQGTHKSLSPDSFSLKKIELANYKGDTAEIQGVVVKFSITESLYTNTLVANFSVKDSDNFFENFPITGQETIRVQLERKTNFTQSETNEKLDLFFFITEYPVYGRAGQHTQVYSFSAISPHAYKSSLSKISRGYKGISTDVIKHILTKDLKISEENIVMTGDAISTSTGVINTQSPLSAVEWLRSKTFDVDMSPFFVFQTIWGKIQVSSLASLVNDETNPVYGAYTHTTGFRQNAQTDQDYLEKVGRIVDIASNLKLGKVFQASDGAWASRNRYLDYSTKTYTKYDYAYSKDLFPKGNTLEKNPVIDERFKVHGESLENLPESHCEYTSINSKAYKGGNYNSLRQETHGITNAYQEVLETSSHEVILFGDMGLNPGRKIELRVQRSVDPLLLKELFDKNPNDIWDAHMSGKYMITSAIHNFEDGKYFTSVKVKRDSFSLDIDK